tara:strand:- start:249 stop:686 length:438 start_codon:yes stop_codon:yes gene_type:complete
MDPFLAALLEYGSMGLFAAFLVWQHLSMQKRFDKMVDKFQVQLNKITEKSETNEDKLRARYDSVINDLQSEKIDSKIELNERIKNILEKLDNLPFQGLGMTLEGISLNQQNIISKIDNIVKSFKRKEEEEKIKAMAKEFSKNNEG